MKIFCSTFEKLDTKFIRVNNKSLQTTKMKTLQKWETENQNSSPKHKYPFPSQNPKKNNFFKVLEIVVTILKQMNKQKDSPSKGKNLYEY